jgi:peptidoglycan/xylan/chitin deacetylase (PgdA/CDA1 family)
VVVRPLLALVLALAVTLSLSPRGAGAAAGNYFPETGHTLGAHFAPYWKGDGGVRQFGLPLSEEFVEDGRTTQYFERAVLHHFSEQLGTPWAVQPAHLGREALAARPSEATPAVGAVAPPADGRRYFPETGHTLGGAFGRAWDAGGGLPTYGFPLTEEFIEDSPTDGLPRRTQYFERVRFEYHPEFAGGRDEVLTGLLGFERARVRGLFDTPPFAPVPAPPASARTIARVATDRPLIALTFDAGADRGFAPQILDTLAAGEVRASFGLTGQWARANPDLVRRIAADGHQVINHTDSHRSFTGLSDRRGGLSADERIAELDRADASIAPLIGRSTRPWFRPPYGDYDAAGLEQVAAAGYGYNVMWTVDTLGWNGLSPAAIVDRTLRAATPGAIVLLHVGADSRDAAALGALIDGLRARDYEFVTVAELVGE